MREGRGEGGTGRVCLEADGGGIDYIEDEWVGKIMYVCSGR